jgi:hypothetical protein
VSRARRDSEAAQRPARIRGIAMARDLPLQQTPSAAPAVGNVGGRIMIVSRSIVGAVLVMAGLMVAGPCRALTAQAPASPDQLVAALKQNLADGQKRLKQYEWVETTTIALKGEEKARTQKRVYYGADGKLTKVPMGEPAAKAAPSGGAKGGRLKAQVVANKKDDMKDYMERATALIQKYVPPSAASIQKAKDAGHMTVQPPQAGTIHVEFKDFVQPADVLSLDVSDKAALLALKVATYLDKKDDAVTLEVAFGALTDGTSYTAKTTLNAAAKNLTVVIANAGHKPLK